MWGASQPASPRPSPGNVHLRGEHATYPRAGALWVEAILLPPGRAVEEGVWAPGGGSAKEHPVGAVGLGDRGRCGWGRAGPLGGERAAEVSEDGAGHGRSWIVAMARSRPAP